MAKTISNTFDAHNPEHVKAYEYYLMNGTILIDGIRTYEADWESIIMKKMVAAWMKHSMEKQNVKV